MALPVTVSEIEQLEIDLLFEALYRRYGYDFRHYATASATRRVMRRLAREKLDSVSMLQHRVLHDASIAESLLRDLSINVTEMFRDPEFYQAVREQVLPELQACDHVKCWHAGCATGEEIYSMAILLTEEGLYQKSQLYATDFNEIALETARKGIYPVSRMQLYSKNYLLAGCNHSLSDYYHAKYGHAVMDDQLRDRMVFANHNLATDAAFGDMQMVVCRNVLIYFDTELQNRVFQLFADSLNPGGYLCLGSHESLAFSVVADQYDVLNEKQRIYRKRF